MKQLKYGQRRSRQSITVLSKKLKQMLSKRYDKENDE